MGGDRAGAAEPGRGVSRLHDDEAAVALDLGDLAGEEQSRRVELTDDRRPPQLRSGAEPGAVVDGAASKRAVEIGLLAADDGVRGGAAPRPLANGGARQRPRRADAQGDDLDGRVLLTEGVEALVEAVKSGDCRFRRLRRRRLAGPRHGQLETLVEIAEARLPADGAAALGHAFMLEPLRRLLLQLGEDPAHG